MTEFGQVKPHDAPATADQPVTGHRPQYGMSCSKLGVSLTE